MAIRRTRIEVLIGLALLCAACGQQGGEADKAPVRARSAPAESVPSPPTVPATPRLHLAANGLELSDAATGASQLIAFGTPEAAARTAVESVTGAPSARTDDPNCVARPAFRLDYPGGLALSFEAGRFAAWEQGASGGYRMRDGIAIGTTRDWLRARGPLALHRVNVTGSVMEEFTAGPVSGVLLNGRVQDFTAGERACP